MRNGWWSWRTVVGLIVLAALAQACGGSSSKSTGPGSSRTELRFDQVKGARLGALPQGCSQVEITAQPGGQVFTGTDNTVSLLLPAGVHTLNGKLFCGGQIFLSTNNPQIVVPPGLGTIDVTLTFGDVNVLLTVVVGPGVTVTGPGINCPGDCTESVLRGTSVSLKSSPSNAVFTGGCGGTGGCTVNLNASKTVQVNLPTAQPQLGSITVDNVDLCGECGIHDLDITIDGVLVASDLSVPDPPVTTQVTPNVNHTVRGTCSNGSSEFQQRIVSVAPGQNVIVAFDSSQYDCD